MRNWSSEQFCNRWLRSQAQSPSNHRSTLIISTPEPSEQALVLETIQKYVKLMNIGKVKIEECHGEIKLSVGDSREMST